VVPRISGDVTVKDRTTHVSVPFSDIWNNLDFGGEVQMEARKGRWGVLFQTNYLRLTPVASLSRPAEADLVQGGPEVRGADVRLDSRTWLTEFGGFYRLVACGVPHEQGAASLDVLAGGRYWYLRNHVFLNLPERGVSFSDTAYGDVIDPMIGFRMQAYLAPNFFFNLRGDAAGFGVSSNSSHVSWNAVGGLGYDVAPCATIVAGYRYLYINYGNSGGTGLRLTLQGPMAGFAYTF
jgi:opacity protein-like surface antigen